MLDPYRECIGDGLLVGTASTQPEDNFCTALDPQEGCCGSQMAVRGEHVVNEDYSLPSGEERCHNVAKTGVDSGGTPMRESWVRWARLQLE